MGSRSHQRLPRTLCISGAVLALLTGASTELRAQRWIPTLDPGDSTSSEIQLDPGTEPAPPCSDTKMDEIRDEADAKENSSVRVDCSFSLERGERITKRLILEGGAASRIEIDCNRAIIDGGPDTWNHEHHDRGANMIEVVSKTVAFSPVWLASPPKDVMIRGCEVIGSVRVWPLDEWRSSNQGELAEISRRPGYVEQLRANAPARIHFDDMIFHGLHHTPVFIGRGVTDARLTNSFFYGDAAGVALYLEAESSGALIADNRFHIATDAGRGPREIVAIDGSERNRIVGNFFSALHNGGIYLFRNCGEESIVRHTTPSHNQLIDNVFHYDQYDGSEPAIFLGSRNGHGRFSDYCHLDDDFGAGSGADDRSFARFNVVMQNQIYQRSVEESIKTEWTDVNTPNYVGYNESVHVHEERASGCYAESAYGKFLRDGETTRLGRDVRGQPICTDLALRCVDGELRPDPYSLPACEIERVPFDCHADGDDIRCNGSVTCPSGTTRVRAFAGCDLEYGNVTAADLAEVEGEVVRIVQQSGVPSADYCHVGDDAAKEGATVLDSLEPHERAYFGCHEYDNGGGDCHIRGELYCERTPPPIRQRATLPTFR